MLVISQSDMDSSQNQQMLVDRAELFLRNHRENPVQTFDFFGIKLRILRDVFNPRYGPSTRILVRCLREYVQEDDHVLDLGTGSGALALMAALTAKSVVATDISPYAVECARANIEHNGFTEKVQVREGDLFAALQPDERFSLIIWNPAFMDTKATDMLELTIYDEGNRTLRQFFQEAENYLEADGRIMMIFGSSGDIRVLEHLITVSPFQAKVIHHECIMIDFFVYELHRST